MGVGSLCFLSPLLCECVAVSLGCVCVWILHVCMHACRSGHPPGGDQTRGRRLPADSESSEFPRIDQASSAKPAAVQPGPAQPKNSVTSLLGVGSIVMSAVTDCVWFVVCGVYMSACNVCICMYVLGGLRSLGGAWWC